MNTFCSTLKQSKQNKNTSTMKRPAIAILTFISPIQAFQQPPPMARHSFPLTRYGSSTALPLLKGLLPSIDDDINAEIAEASLSPLDLFRRELSATNSPLQALSAVMKRQKDKSGDYENKFKILSDNRSYSDRVLLDKDHVNVAPNLSDLNQKQPQWIKVLWSRSYFRLFVFVSAFMAFPVLCNVLNTLVKIDPEEFDIINEQFTPGIGILYGTFVALTLDILYERQGKVQENASVEASLLSLAAQNILSLFRDEEKIAREATQIIADQVRIIVYRSRGAEMLNIMRSDPYARLMSLVDRYQRSKSSFTPWEEALIDGLRGEIPVLMEARARRLSDEASALPPTHFLVLTLLTALSLIGFTAATVSIQPNQAPPLEARMVFAGLTAIYVLFFNFSNDMNDPFDGVYQIKRSSAASYLLQIKWLVANQPWGQDIRFDTRAAFVPEFDGDVLEVVGNDGKKSLGSTMKMMESVAEAISTAVIVSEVPEKVDVNVVNGDSVGDNVVSSTALDQKVMKEPSIEVNDTVAENGVNGESFIGQVASSTSTASEEKIVEELFSVEVKSEAANTHLPQSKVPMNYEQEQSVVNGANGLPDAKESVAHKVSLPIDQIEPATKDSLEAAPIINQTDLDTTHQQSQLDTSTIKRPKEQSAKDYLPSYFRTLSGFSEEEKNAAQEASVTVPNAQSSQSSPRVSGGDRQTAASANYFRNVGGFMH